MKSLAWAVFFSLHTATLAFVPRSDSSCGTCTTEKPSILCQFSSLFKPSCKPSLLKYTNQESEWEESEWYSPPPPAAATGTEQSVSEEQPTRLPRGVTTKVTVIRSKVDLEKFLEEDDRLCVVRFHAAWCKSCQAFSLKFGKIASQYADWEKQGCVVKENKVRIAEVEWGANTQLCKDLGVKKLPSIFFYSSGVKINGFAAGPTKFALVRDAVKRYSNMTPADLHFEAELEKGKKLMEETARKERFEEVAKARQLRRAASSQSPRGTIRLRE